MGVLILWCNSVSSKVQHTARVLFCLCFFPRMIIPIIINHHLHPSLTKNKHKCFHSVECYNFTTTDPFPYPSHTCFFLYKKPPTYCRFLFHYVQCVHEHPNSPCRHHSPRCTSSELKHLRKKIYIYKNLVKCKAFIRLKIISEMFL